MTSGIQVAMNTLGGAIAVYGIICAFLLKETPGELGLLPDNKPLDEGNVLAVGADDVEWTLADILKKKQFWFVSVGWGMELLGVVGFISIAVSYMISQGVPQTQAVWAMSIVGIVQLFSGFLSGVIDQKVGPLKTSILLFVV